MTSDTVHRDAWRLGWVWWTLVGALTGLGIVGILTIGPVVLAVAAVLAGVALLMPRARNGSAYMVIAGAAAAPLTLAWLNRQGPGTVCRTSGSEQACIDQWSPWPFLAVGLVLMVGGVLLTTRWDKATAGGAVSAARKGGGATSAAGAERTREALVRAAVEVLAERGYAGATARVVAGRAAMQPGPGLLPLRICRRSPARGVGLRVSTPAGRHRPARRPGDARSGISSMSSSMSSPPT